MILFVYYNGCEIYVYVIFDKLFFYNVYVMFNDIISLLFSRMGVKKIIIKNNKFGMFC